jgi:hypothetical protein
MGIRKRQTTMTDVKFLSPTLLLAAHRYAGKLYLIRLDTPTTHTILYTLTITRGTRQQQTEIFDVSGDSIYLIDYTEYLYIIKRIGETLVLESTHRINSNGVPYHCVRVKGSKLYLTPSAKHIQPDSIIVFDIPSRTWSSLPSLSPMYRYKGMDILANGNIVLLVNYKVTCNMNQVGYTIDSALLLYTP